jgi:tetratricopeptide (TPR) repeat protein
MSGVTNETAKVKNFNEPELANNHMNSLTEKGDCSMKTDQKFCTLTDETRDQADVNLQEYSTKLITDVNENLKVEINDLHEKAIQCINNCEFSSAIILLKKSVGIACKIFKWHHPLVCNSIALLATSYINSRIFDKAKICHLRAIKCFEYLNKIDSDYCVEAYFNLGAIAMEQKDYNAAIEYSNKSESLMMNRKIWHGKDVNAYASLCLMLAEAYLHTKDIDKAMAYYQMASRVYCEDLKCSPLHIFGNLQLFAKKLVEAKYYKQAEDLCKKALSVSSDCHPYVNKCKGVAYHTLAALYNRMGRLKKSKEYYTKALKLLGNNFNKSPGFSDYLLNYNN